MRVVACQRVEVETGVTLGTDVYLPDGPGPWPVVLSRTPYNRWGMQHGAKRFVERGIAWVTQDCRGRYDSTGPFTPLVHEANDGQKTLDWIANQRWCNGRIGMSGLSYLGIVQVPAAAGGHEALRCIAPGVAPGSFFTDWVRYDGCFALANAVRWSLTHASCLNQPPCQHFSWGELNALPSLDAIAERAGFMAPVLRDWVAHDTYDDYWRAVDQNLMHAKVAVPALHGGGWYDHISRNTFNAYRNIRDHGATAAARSGQHIVVGPYGHTNFAGTAEAQQSYGQWQFGAQAAHDYQAYEMQFLDFYLRDEDNGFTSRPRVKLFVMGDNHWAGFDDYPVPGTTIEPWHLTSGGSANMATGDGALSREAPDADRADSYSYDPANPTPTYGGAIYWGMQGDYAPETKGGILGPIDQRPVLTRHDMLCYRSAPLEGRMVVIGDIELDLTIASSAEDTDFIAKLCVQETDGRIMPIANGSLRLRYRESWSQPKALTPGQATRISLHLGQTAYAFSKGQRIVVTITSSCFPRILPHPNTIAPTWTETQPVVATNSILHGPTTPSTLKLPIVEM